MNSLENLLNQSTDNRVLHLRIDGTSRDIGFADLQVGGSCSDNDIKAAVALHLDIAANRLSDMIVERHENGNFTLRPQAVFG